MMKNIKYKIQQEYNIETEEFSETINRFVTKIAPYSVEREETAKREAYNGEYEIYDDGQPEPEQPMSDAERIAQLEEALEMILSGAVE